MLAYITQESLEQLYEFWYDKYLCPYDAFDK